MTDRVPTDLPDDLAIDPGEPRVMSGRIWEELCDTLRDAGQLVVTPAVPSTPLESAAGLRHLTRFLAAGINLCVANADPDHPRLTRMMDLDMHWGLDSPDCLYLAAPLRGEAVYRLWGDPGSANHLDIQVNTGHPAEGRIEGIRTIGSISGDELVCKPDGSIELFLGGPKREPNWLPSASDARTLQIRQNFLDWENERPADFMIERVGGAVTRPPVRTDEIEARIDLLQRWFSQGGALWKRLSAATLDREPNIVSAFAIPTDSEHTGLKGQIYCQGTFECAPDQAVIVEFAPPPCRHWSLSLADPYWESVDFFTRQSSLNGHQAKLDADGVFRAVIAQVDPGVPNWLDPAGHERGIVFGRFILAEGDPPSPATRRVELAKLRDSLPPDTLRVTPEEREAVLYRRREAAIRRYRR